MHLVLLRYFHLEATLLQLPGRRWGRNPKNRNLTQNRNHNLTETSVAPSIASSACSFWLLLWLNIHGNCGREPQMFRAK